MACNDGAAAVGAPAMASAVSGCRSFEVDSLLRGVAGLDFCMGMRDNVFESVGAVIKGDSCSAVVAQGMTVGCAAVTA